MSKYEFNQYKQYDSWEDDMPAQWLEELLNKRQPISYQVLDYSTDFMQVMLELKDE